MEVVDGENYKLFTIIYKWEDANKRISERHVFVFRMGGAHSSAIATIFVAA